MRKSVQTGVLPALSTSSHIRQERSVLQCLGGMAILRQSAQDDIILIPAAEGEAEA
jgi:hypothetical protein